MGRIYGKIKIELMSDLCAGSGYSYAGVIDSDVFYDAYGIPVIPARRLKGCMREAAELVCPETAETLFGKSGDNGTKGIILGNAYIADYEAVAEELCRLQRTNKREAHYLSPQNILKRYTGIRAQTKLCEDTGTAEENTLRYTRVVGQYDPRKENENLCFYARVDYDEVCKEQMKRIVKALRNLGMNRNRGLGSVRCSLLETEKDKEWEVTTDWEAEERVCLTYVLRNQEPLLMSGDNTSISDSHISGKSILGTLAGAYLCMKGAEAESEEFRRLFLDGSTLFTDANLTFPPKEGKEAADRWPDYYPAPFYLNRLKKTKVLVNLLGRKEKLSLEEEAKYNPEKGNQPKKLKTHYVHEAEPGVYDIVEPERELVYHNSQTEELYSLEAMAERQYFRGQIYTDGKYAGLLKELLEKSRLSFGKSKTAQYGACELAAEVKLKKAAAEEFSLEAGERVAVVFGSDAVFRKETGYTVKYEEVKEMVGECLGIPYDQTVDEGSILQTKEITGYNTTWNLRCPGVPAVKAGSVLVYTIPVGVCWMKALRPDETFVGERNLEGCGQIRILKCSDMVYAAKCVKVPDREAEEPVSGLKNNLPFLLSILTEQLLEHLVFQYTRSGSGLNLTPSTVGRLSLMLQESLNEYRSDPDRAFADFGSRIASIKRKKEKREAFRLLDLLMRKESKDEVRNELDLEKLADDRGDERLREIRELLAQYSTKEEYRRRLSGIWGVYMKQIFTYHKYLKKHEGGSGNDEE